MRLILTTLTAATLFTLADTSTTAAQWIREPQLITVDLRLSDDAGFRPPHFERAKEASDVGLFLGGAAGAAVGSVGGAFVGYHLDRQHFPIDSGDDPGLIGALGGWFIGSALVTPLSVYLANGREGPLSTAYVSSAVIGTLGLVGALSTANSSAGLFFLFGTPVAQAISATVIARDSRR